MSRRAISIGLTGVIVIAAISLGVILLGDDDDSGSTPDQVEAKEDGLEGTLIAIPRKATPGSEIAVAVRNTGIKQMAWTRLSHRAPGPRKVARCHTGGNRRARGEVDRPLCATGRDNRSAVPRIT